MSGVLRLTNVEGEGRKITVLFEREGQTRAAVLETNQSIVLQANERFISMKVMPRHLGIEIDTLHLGVTMAGFS